MLRKVRIKDFRSIVDQELDFGKVNLFIGPNGSGKSNVLEAIGILSAALGRSIEPEDLDRKGVRLSLPRLFKASFKHRKLPKNIRLEAKGKNVGYTSSIIAGDDSSTLRFQHEAVYDSGHQVIGQSPRGKKIHDRIVTINSPKNEGLSSLSLSEQSRGVFDAYREFANISDEALAEFDALANYAIYTPQTAILRGIASDSRNVEPLGLTGGRLAVAIQEILRSVSNASGKEREHIANCLEMVWKMGWPEEFSVGAPDSNIVPPQVPVLPRVLYVKDRYMHTRRNLLSAFDASEGVLYVTFVAALLAHPLSPRTFALDNVDGTLNPSLVRYLVEQTADTVSESPDERQVFMTSHNPTALDALDLFNDDHRVYVVSRDSQTGYTRFERVKPPDGMSKSEWDRRRGGRNYSTMMLEGLIPGALNEI